MSLHIEYFSIFPLWIESFPIFPLWTESFPIFTLWIEFESFPIFTLWIESFPIFPLWIESFQIFPPWIVNRIFTYISAVNRSFSNISAVNLIFSIFRLRVKAFPISAMNRESNLFQYYVNRVSSKISSANLFQYFRYLGKTIYFCNLFNSLVPFPSYHRSYWDISVTLGSTTPLLFFTARPITMIRT